MVLPSAYFSLCVSVGLKCCARELKDTSKNISKLKIGAPVKLVQYTMERINVAVLQIMLPVCGIIGRFFQENGLILSANATLPSEAGEPCINEVLLGLW